MIICIDFDGTCVTHEFPNVGRDIGADRVLRQLVDRGHRLVLFTMRSGQHLDEAVEWFSEHKIPLWGIQRNPEQDEWTESPKAYGNVYIDDAALGCPLKPAWNDSTRPYVDWARVEELLIDKGVL